MLLCIHHYKQTDVWIPILGWFVNIVQVEAGEDVDILLLACIHTYLKSQYLKTFYT